MASYDLIVRGGTVVDGTGAAPRTADVAVRDGIVVEVGRVEGAGARVIDAAGALVTPGFVDIHTHYDGQATWDSALTPSAWHGVTTVVMGNCGVGFAPVRPTDHDRLVELMEGVEDIPGAALHEGLSWEWESFAEYLDAVERRPHDIDVAAQVPHGAVRLYVMGERGAAREPATPEDIAAMADLVRQGIQAGALGFTTSRTLNHRTSTGDFTPTLTAEAAELLGIAQGMTAGVIEVVSDFADLDAEFSLLQRMVEVSGRPLSISIAQEVGRGDWRVLLDRIDQANAAGLPMRGQVPARAIGLLLGLQATLNPFLTRPSYREVADLPVAERAARMADPRFKARLLAEDAGGGQGRRAFTQRWDRMFRLTDPPDYEPGPEKSIAAEAARAGRSPDEYAYDTLLEDEGRRLLYFPLLNYADGDLEAVREMLSHRWTVPGLSDGGAHVGTICDASFPTTLLTHWARDRSRGDRLELAALVRAQTSDTAEAVGLGDRGVLAPGRKADLNVIDFEGLTLHPPTMAFDLPAGGKRLLQRADGYLHTVVSGVPVYEGGQATGALPGRLVRGALHQNPLRAGARRPTAP
jgi:N-acyl-D-aspartate/D-glutamate deacylase